MHDVVFKHKIKGLHTYVVPIIMEIDYLTNNAFIFTVEITLGGASATISILLFRKMVM